MNHYANLSNGIWCACGSPMDGVTRIQSTACEQKLWDSVVWGAGPDLLYWLAAGECVTVHDVSERPRMPRALWQGVPMLRYFCERAWGLEPGPVLFRNGNVGTAYAEQSWRSLPDPVRNHLQYFRKFTGDRRGVLTVCSTRPDTLA